MNIHSKYFFAFIFSVCFYSTLFAQTGHIIWQDNFNSLDPKVWNIDLGDGCDENLCGWGNQELQSYLQHQMISGAVNWREQTKLP